ncbi:hypothetical protein BJ322DRAFT_1114425 [Thelephora terrestris]|uniref:Uncharacterized protein n=1 Tax=Thelephora terrestris TaxID=56493 RepID=A0A9P6L155_9AGAM|nr:hypothetical protein BJ322DRAFT_1114425 [Thelephora terrestris]
MSDPESAQLVKVSEVSLELVNKKLRLYGRVYSYDVDTSLIVLCDPDTSLRKGVWVDVTLCLNPKYSAPWKREPMHMVIVVGYLEACEPPLHELDQGGALLGHLEIDSRWRLQAIVLESCDDLNVEALDETEMDQPRNMDQKVTQELVSRLTEEVTNLKNENSMLKDQLGISGDENTGESVRSYDDLLEEIDGLKDELSQRPSQDVVDEMEGKIAKHKDRKREWRDQINYLTSQLYEAESGKDDQEGLKEELEWEVEKLGKDFKEKIQKKEEAIARLEAQQAVESGELRFTCILDDTSPSCILLEPLPKKRKDNNIFPLKEAGAIKWADQGGRFVVALPSVIYNGKTQLTEPFHGNVVTDFLYEVFVDANATYYGSYRCIKRAPVEWNVLTSLGQGFVTSFLNRLVVEKDLAAPAIESLVRHMYATGSLKAECLAFQSEGSGEAPY